MPKVLVCQHVPYEVLGTLDPLLRRVGSRIRYVNFGRVPEAEPSIDGYQALIVLGGPMNVDQTADHPHLKTEIKLIGRAIDEGIPVLGICLGAQLVAKALGAEVRKNPEKEIGWYDVSLTDAGKADPLFSDFDPQEKIFQWHGDTFDIPPGAQLLASSEICANQAFRWGDRVYAFQFHLEVDEPMIERWLNVPVHRRELEELEGKIDPDEIRSLTPKHIDRLHVLSDRAFGGFLRLFGLARRTHALASR